MRVLDLFCGGGGASMGYHRAWPHAEIVGVDLEPQPNYPFEFVQADATTFPLDGFDFRHASPPCQGYSSSVVSDGKWTNHSEGINTPRLIAPMRERLEASGAPWVIENVVGAREALRSPGMLCGVMFGRPTPRHRLFEVSWPMLWPPHGACRGAAKRWAADNGVDYRDMSVTGKSRRSGCIDTWRLIMDMPWAGRARELSEAIYPAYTEFLAGQVAPVEVAA